MRQSRKTSRRWDIRRMDPCVVLFKGLLVLGLVVATLPEVMVLGSSASTLVMDHEIPLKKCRYSRAYSMLQVACKNLGLDEVPMDLKTDIQVLDASVNRIRELTNESLASYTNLGYLYLGDNFIQSIQEGAFANQRDLQVLDLTKNGFDVLPKSLFQLPVLRKVYLSNNRLRDSTFQTEVTSPLNFLELSKNRLCRIPEIGPLPTLMHLNVSENMIATISTEELAPFCSLKILDFTKNPIKFDGNTCDCQVFHEWLKVRGIHTKPTFNCTNSVGCSSVEFTNRTSELYNECTQILQMQIETEKARSMWITVACCVSAFLFCVFVSLFCVHKRNKRKRRKLKEQQRLTVNNANTELLNSNLNQPENT